MDTQGATNVNVNLDKNILHLGIFFSPSHLLTLRKSMAPNKVYQVKYGASASQVPIPHLTVD